MTPTSPLSWAATLLESGELGEPDPWWSDVRRLAQRLDWKDCGTRLVAARLEWRPHVTEQAAARSVAAILPSLQPRDWDSAPEGEELTAAVLEAYRASRTRPDPIGRVDDDKHPYPQLLRLPVDLRPSPTVPLDQAEGQLGAKNGRKLDTLAEPPEPRG
jgi:hypothetical protein